MGIFRQKLVIESTLPMQEAWKRLLPVVKSDLPTCRECGHMLAVAAVRFCSNCGLPAQTLPPRQTWMQRQFSSGGIEFEGDLSPREFKISRIISYRNSCLPVIRGRFEPSATGTRVVIEMKMHPLGWVLLVGFVSISFLVLSVLAGNGQGTPATGILAVAAPCFIVTVCWLAFAAEANMARAALSQLWPIH
jgi:hypothetical protein